MAMANLTFKNSKKLSLVTGKLISFPNLIFVTCIFSLFPSVNDLKQLHKFYDADCDGQVSYKEFVGALGEVKASERVQKL